MFDELTFSDGAFIVFASFVLLVLTTLFITLPEEGGEKVIYLVETYIIVLIAFTFFYNFLKQKSNNATYMTQDRLLMATFIILITLVVYFVSMEIYSQRNKRYGFIYFVAGIVFVIIFVILIAADKAITQRYGLNLPNQYNSMNIQSRYKTK